MIDTALPSGSSYEIIIEKSILVSIGRILSSIVPIRLSNLTGGDSHTGSPGLSYSNGGDSYKF